MSKLPGITEELKRRPVFDVHTLLGQAQIPEGINEAPHDPVGSGPSYLGPSIRDVHSGNSPGATPGRVDNHDVVPEDPINPAHYRRHPSGIECIEVTRHMNFNTGNAIKYIWRYLDKGDPAENLKKAQWYLDDEIRRLEGKR